MARPYRLQSANCLYHITSRGDDRKKIYTSDSDYQKFLKYLLKAKDKYQFYLYAYVLMPNHYHFLIETKQANLSRIMQYVNTSYTTYYNVKHQRCGHLFQGRFKSLIVDKDNYLLELTRYIHLNPVRAGIVKQPNRYRWSSCQEYLDIREDDYIDKDEISKYLNMSGKQYLDFVLEGRGNAWDPFKDVYAGFILGQTKFIEDKLQAVQEQVGSRDVSYKKELKRHINTQEIIKLVAKEYNTKTDELLRKKNRFLKERKIAIYLMKRLTSLTNVKIGEAVSISYSGVSKVAAEVEKLMEQDMKFKEEIERLISNFKV